MFSKAMAHGGLDVQLVYYRGHDECKASRWVSQPTQLASMMERIHVAGGYTQIGKVLAQAKRENAKQKVQALVFVGDGMEEEIDVLCHAAAKAGVPCFMFQEGDDEGAKVAFREIARLTHGAYHRFDAGSAKQLGELLGAAAAYAAGGMGALGKTGAIKLLEQMKNT